MSYVTLGAAEFNAKSNAISAGTTAWNDISKHASAGTVTKDVAKTVGHGAAAYGGAVAGATVAAAACAATGVGAALAPFCGMLGSLIGGVVGNAIADVGDAVADFVSDLFSNSAAQERMKKRIHDSKVAMKVIGVDLYNADVATVVAAVDAAKKAAALHQKLGLPGVYGYDEFMRNVQQYGVPMEPYYDAGWIAQLRKTVCLPGNDPKVTLAWCDPDKRDAEAKCGSAGVSTRAWCDPKWVAETCGSVSQPLVVCAPGNVVMERDPVSGVLFPLGHLLRSPHYHDKILAAEQQGLSDIAATALARSTMDLAEQWIVQLQQGATAEGAAMATTAAAMRVKAAADAATQKAQAHYAAAQAHARIKRGAYELAGGEPSYAIAPFKGLGEWTMPNGLQLVGLGVAGIAAVSWWNDIKSRRKVDSSRRQRRR